MGLVQGTPTGSGERQRAFFIAALALVIISLSFAYQYQFWPNRLELLDQGKIVNYENVYRLIFVQSIVIWVWCLSVVLPFCIGETFTSRRILVSVTTVMLYISFILMYPTNAIDVYIYAARSHLFTTHGENPHAVTPNSFWESDPYVQFASPGWAGEVSPYGPLWNLLAWPITRFDGDSIGVAVIGFKVLSTIAALIIGWLIYDTVRRERPRYALPAMLFWLWNPLVLWEGIGNGHNDVVMMLFVVAALWAYQGRHDSWVIPLLLPAILIKYVAIILLPLAIVALWKRNPSWTRRAEGVFWALAAGVGLIGLSLFPFFDLTAVREGARAQEALMSESLSWLVYETLPRWGVDAVSQDAVQNVTYSVAAIAVLVGCIVCWRAPKRLPRVVFEVTFVFLLVASTNHRAWYVIWLVPLAAMLIPETPWRRTIVWCITSLLVRAFTIWSWGAWDWPRWGWYGFGLVVVAMVFGPLLVTIAFDLWTALRARRPVSHVPDRAIASPG